MRPGMAKRRAENVAQPRRDRSAFPCMRGSVPLLEAESVRWLRKTRERRPVTSCVVSQTGFTPSGSPDFDRENVPSDPGLPGSRIPPDPVTGWSGSASGSRMPASRSRPGSATATGVANLVLPPGGGPCGTRCARSLLLPSRTFHCCNSSRLRHSSGTSCLFPLWVRRGLLRGSGRSKMRGSRSTLWPSRAKIASRFSGSLKKSIDSRSICGTAAGRTTVPRTSRGSSGLIRVPLYSLPRSP